MNESSCLPVHERDDQHVCYSVSRHSVTALLSSFSDCGENAVVGDQECVLLSAVLLLRCNMLSVCERTRLCSSRIRRGSAFGGDL